MRSWMTVLGSFVVGFGTVFACGRANAAGYEKSIMWGGESAGMAGIAAPYVQGAEALYFNPAGLVKDKGGQDIALDISPTWEQVKAPINDQNEQETSSMGLMLPFGVLYDVNVTPNLGFGVGAYVSGGGDVDFGSQRVTNLSAQSGQIDNQIQIYEIALGGAYKVNDWIQLGAAWRTLILRGQMAFVERLDSTNFLNVHLDNLQDTEYTGFKLGAQFKLSDSFKLGVVYRSQVNLSASGTVSGQEEGAGVTSIGSNSATVKTAFPMMATVAAQFDVMPNFRLLGEYDWAQYSVVNNIEIDGQILTSSQTKLIENWNDQNNIRLGAEYHGWDWPIRGGLMWTSQVTDPNHVQPVFPPPADAYTFTLGTGHDFGVLSHNLKLDGAFEYTRLDAQVTGTAAGLSGAGTDVRSGNYHADVYALHLGCRYLF